MKDTNVPVEEKCEACKAWESETGYGKLCNHFDMKSVPVEKEKWEKEFDETFVLTENGFRILIPDMMGVQPTIALLFKHQKAFISQALQASRIEAKEEERTRIGEEVKKSWEWNMDREKVLSIINKHQ